MKDPSIIGEHSFEDFHDLSEWSQSTINILTLSDRSFPLICCFDDFLQILESTMTAVDRQNFDDVANATHLAEKNVLMTRQAQHKEVQVDSRSFRMDFWQRFSHNLTKGLSAPLVFAEIMGIVKGSEASRDRLLPLCREDYVRRSSRLAPTFSEHERARVYDIFEAYEHMKRQDGRFDRVDQVVRLIMEVRKQPALGNALRAKFDEIYVDEVQDHHCLDIELLLSLVRDGRGFHCAGDTAQAISQDSTFRFADVKKMIFDHFGPAGDLTGQKELARPHMFTLPKNFRSHQGILALASIIMGLIWAGFPETVDKLEPEIGALSGPKPILFKGCDISILTSGMGSNELSKSSRDFGAEQVILVRNEEAKRLLQHQIGEIALIFTILDSKGMEFDDVIIWNFFSDCPDQPGLRSLEKLRSNPISFDAKRHSGMCSELKNFYVAITRARIQLFILETSEEAVKAVQELLVHDTTAPLVDVTKPDHDDFPVLLESMRPKDSVDLAGWARRAAELMQRRMFSDAILPFRRAEDRIGELTARAFLDEEVGRTCFGRNDLDGFHQHLRDACTNFMEADLINDAVRVLISLNDFERAADIWLAQREPSKAAPLFSKAGLYEKAVECHDQAEEHAEAAAILREREEHDQLVPYLVTKKDRMDPSLIRRYGALCKLLLKQEKLSANTRGAAIQLLGTPQDQETCFRLYGMDEHLATLLMGQERYKDLYQLHYRLGHVEIALELALTKNLLHVAEVTEMELIQLLDFAFADHYLKGTQQSLIKDLGRPSNHVTSEMLAKIKQWKDAESILISRKHATYLDAISLDETTSSKFYCVAKIFNHHDFERVLQWGDLPFVMMHSVTNVAKGLVLNEDADSLAIVHLITGLWRASEVEPRCRPLSWSPLSSYVRNDSAPSLPELAKQWFLDNMASAILAFNRRARKLWIMKQPERCIHYLTRGTNFLQ